MKKMLGSLGVALVGLALTACSSAPDTNEPQPAPAPPAGSETAPPPAQPQLDTSEPDARRVCFKACLGGDTSASNLGFCGCACYNLCAQ